MYRRLLIVLAVLAAGSIPLRAGESRQSLSSRPNVPATVAVAKEPYLVLTLKFTTPQARRNAVAMLRDRYSDTVHVLTAHDDFVDIFLRAKNSDAAQRAYQSAEGFEWEDEQDTLMLPPPLPTPPRAKPRFFGQQEVVSGGLRGKTGKGVLLAIIDTGIDFRLEDFIDHGQSHLLYYWDTTAPHPSAGDADCKTRLTATYPNGETIGALYSRQALTRALKDPQAGIRGDQEGHGTACAAIAAGLGSRKEGTLPGVAPGVDLIAVRIADDNGKLNAYLLNAICEWLDRVAQDEHEPLVISCSFGGRLSGYDGKTGREQHLNSRFPLDRKGRALCISAGNDGEGNFNTEVVLDPAKAGTGELRWHAPVPGTLEIYFDTPNRADLDFAGPLAPEARKELFFSGPAQSWRLSLTVPSGEGELTLKAVGTHPVIADAYIYCPVPFRTFAKYPVNMGSFEGTAGPRRERVEAPGTTPNAITVGSYDWSNVFRDHQLQVDYRFYLAQGRVVVKKNGKEEVQKTLVADPVYREMNLGALSAYSSPGPRRLAPIQGAPKPELAAPGQFFTCPRPRHFWSRPNRPAVTAFNGTSAATPYTAGFIALMFECNKDLTLGELRQRLFAGLTRDEATREDAYHEPLPEPPNSHWGYGKLDYDAAQRILADLIGK